MGNKVRGKGGGEENIKSIHTSHRYRAMCVLYYDLFRGYLY